MMREEERKRGEKDGGDDEAEVYVVCLQGSSTLKASEFTWRTRILKGNGVNTSSSKTHGSSTSPTETRWVQK